MLIPESDVESRVGSSSIILLSGWELKKRTNCKKAKRNEKGKKESQPEMWKTKKKKGLMKKKGILKMSSRLSPTTG